jgi:hypothetical protein
VEILLLRWGAELQFHRWWRKPKKTNGSFWGAKKFDLSLETSRMLGRFWWAKKIELSFETSRRGQIDVWRKLSSHLRPRWGANLRKALIWDVEEGSVWGVKKIDLSFWDLDALVPSLSFVLAEIGKERKQLSANLRPRGGVESRG